MLRLVVLQHGKLIPDDGSQTSKVATLEGLLGGGKKAEAKGKRTSMLAAHVVA